MQTILPNASARNTDAPAVSSCNCHRIAGVASTLIGPLAWVPSTAPDPVVDPFATCGRCGTRWQLLGHGGQPVADALSATMTNPPAVLS